MAFVFDDEREKKTGFVFDDEQPKPVRFMEEPTATERFLSGISLPKWMDNLRGSAVYRVAQGMADPVVGAVQTVANVLPDSTGIPDAVNKRVSEVQGEYDSARKARGSEGIDLARIGGNVLSPVNALIASRLPAAATTGARALQGAGVGALGGAMAPVAEAEGYWGQKTAQVGLGALTGGILTPALGKVGDVAIRRLAKAPAVSTHDVDLAIGGALKEVGQSVDDVPADQLAALRQQVGTALQAGKKLDAPAAMRKADFDALDMEPTLGQITRDPKQFAREQNLRGIDGVGDDLLARFAGQERQLQARLPQDVGKDAYRAGNQFAESLKNTDDTLRRHVSGLYTEARQSAGRDLELPTDPLVNTYRQVLADFGDKVPKAIQGKFAKLMPKEPLPGTASPGIFKTLDRVAETQPGPSIMRTLESAAAELGPHGYGAPLRGASYTGALPQNMARPGPKFTFEDADRLRKVINDHVGADPATNKALGRLRAALNEAQQSADDGGGPFAPAVKAAAERFKLHDAVPALKAAADGRIAPDDFVRRFVVGGKTDQVKGLAQVLKQADPDAFQEARAQLADELRRAAFGETNVATKDAAFAPSNYMKAIRRLGVDKLGAFFSPEEVADILRVGRVGSYIKAAPPAAPVSRSNSNVGVVNYLAQFPPFRSVAAIGNNVVRPIQQRSGVRGALAADVPTTDAPMSDAQINYLRYLLGIGGLGAAGAVQ